MYEDQIREAIRHFWAVRNKQQFNQGETPGVKDYGNRGAVTGGKHLDGFIELIASLLTDAGLPGYAIHTQHFQGTFRPTKNWDLVVVVDDQLLATIEFKAQVGSFGNNFNNRVEETL